LTPSPPQFILLAHEKVRFAVFLPHSYSSSLRAAFQFPSIMPNQPLLLDCDPTPVVVCFFQWKFERLSNQIFPFGGPHLSLPWPAATNISHASPSYSSVISTDRRKGPEGSQVGPSLFSSLLDAASSLNELRRTVVIPFSSHLSPLFSPRKVPRGFPCIATVHPFIASAGLHKFFPFRFLSQGYRFPSIATCMIPSSAFTCFPHQTPTEIPPPSNVLHTTRDRTRGI